MKKLDKLHTFALGCLIPISVLVSAIISIMLLRL